MQEHTPCYMDNKPCCNTDIPPYRIGNSKVNTWALPSDAKVMQYINIFNSALAKATMKLIKLKSFFMMKVGSSIAVFLKEIQLFWSFSVFQRLRLL